MKKKFYSLALLFGILFTIGFTEQAYASHAQGADLTYTYVAPNLYQVTYKFYRDCTGITPGTTATISVKSPGCNTGRTITLSRIGNPRIGDAYCLQLGPPTCSATNANYEEYTYSGTLTFSAIEKTCPIWLLSASECSRPSVQNLVNASSYCLYAESMINLGTPAAPIANSSPQFASTNIPIPFVCFGQLNTYDISATDIDGDSLSYKLVSALDSYNTPIAYDTYTGSSTVIINPQDPTQFAILSGGGTFSPTFPLPSYSVNWSGPNPHYAVQTFTLDEASGQMTFTPAAYYNTAPVNGDNKYVVVIQVDEWRKINGVMVKVGYIRRDMLFIVIDCGSNENPSVTNAVANNLSITPGTIINLSPGSMLNFSVNSDDANAANLLEMTSDATQKLPGATFNVSSANHPTGTLTWTPTAADVRSQPYYFHVTVKDNACPIRGYQTQTYAVRVSNSGAVTGVKNELKNAFGFTAYPNPFSQEVSFKFNLQSKTQSLVIYNVLGKEVDRISLVNLATGQQDIRWKNAAQFAAGTYVAKLFSPNNAVETIKFSKL